MNGLLTIVTLLAASSQVGGGEAPIEPRWEDLHPALRVDAATALKLFDKGFKDAARKRDLNGDVNRFRRGIGRIGTSALGTTSTVSWLWADPLQLRIYRDGFNAKKEYRPQNEIDEAKQRHARGWENVRTISFDGLLNIYPSFAGGHGSISRYADSTDLRNVRVVLKVGERIYQPKQHPGDLKMETGTGVNTVEVPHTTSSTRTTKNGVQTVKTKTRWTRHKERYKWFEGRFSVEFDLFDDDGAARITKADKEFVVIVVYGPNERQATFKLSEFADFGK